MKILVLGSSGQLGNCLKEQLSTSNNQIIYSSRELIDVENFKETKEKIYSISPDLIINAAAYTNVDGAEENYIKANLINNLALSNISDICSQHGCFLIHISTDYVFDGKSKSPYHEINKTNPKNVYGQTKLDGEKKIKASGCNYLILRTSWVFSEYGNNFLKTMLRLSKSNKEINVVCDQIGCPTYAHDIAKTIALLINEYELKGLKSSVYHYCGDHECSWYEFAKFIFSQYSDLNLGKLVKLNAVPSSNFPTIAYRPTYSVFDTTKIKNDFEISPSDWKKGVRDSLKAIYKIS